MAKLGKLNVEIGATNNTKRGLKSAESDISKWAKSTRTFGNEAIGKVGTGVAAGFAITAAAAGAAAAAIKGGANSVDDITKASRRLTGNDGATGALAGIRFAAMEAGVESAKLDKGLEKLLDTTSRANHGDKGAIESFQRLGLEAAELTRMKPEERFLVIADAIAGLKDTADKVAFSREIFGKAGGELVNLFAGGSEAIGAATRDAEMFGHSISALDAGAVETMNDEFGRFGYIWEGVTMQLAVKFAPLVSDISGRLLGMIESAGGVGSAVDKAFGAGVEYTADFLDWVEDLNIGWLKFKQTVTGVGLILTDIGNFAANMNPAKKLVEWFQDDVRGQKRELMIAPDKREEFKRLLDESGGFQSEKIDIRAGLLDENTDTQRQIADAESSKRERGSLGDRFKAWERKAQEKGAMNAALKLGEATESRLDGEDDITKELEKQTKEMKAQKGIHDAGQGPLALVAFNGVGSITKAAKEEPGGLAKVASSEEEISPQALPSVVAAVAQEPGVVAQAASVEGTPPMLARDWSPPQLEWQGPDFGTKEYFDYFTGTGNEKATKTAATTPNRMVEDPKFAINGVPIKGDLAAPAGDYGLGDDQTKIAGLPINAALGDLVASYGLGDGQPQPDPPDNTGAWARTSKKHGLNGENEGAWGRMADKYGVERGHAKYEDRIPSGEPNWKSKELDPDRAKNYNSKRVAPDFLAKDAPAYMDKMSPDMEAALAANPMAKNGASPTDMGETNSLLREIKDALRGGVQGRYA